MRTLRSLHAALVALGLVACTPKIVATEPVFDGTGTWSRTVTTSSTDAQRYFDQGLRFLYGFNHDEAIRSFQQAQVFDPKCAMCFWGEALANGPHINNPELDDAHAKAAWSALEKARSLVGAGFEGDVVAALAARYEPPSKPAPRPRTELDGAYASAMTALAKKYPDDVDIGALAAEALIDLRPWDQWTHDGKMQPHTAELVALLDAVLAKAPQHPLANHLAIHAWEPSPTPEHAAVSADRLRTMAPSLAHLVHMPTHIDVRRGRFAEAIVSSQAALDANRAYLAKVPQQGFYRFYVAHNEHMLAYAAMMTGQRALAVGAIRAMVDDIPQQWLTENASVADGIVALPLEVEMRFGLWSEIENSKEPAPELPIARALFRAARAVAFAAEDKIADAKREQAAFADARKAVPAGARFGNNDAQALLDVAAHLVDGEVAVADKRVPEGITALEKAVTAEDALQYDEPPDWLQPARHALGAVLLNNGRAKDAETVYRADLARVPDNGWALLGLAQSLEAQGTAKTDEVKDVRAKFQRIWKDADVVIGSSCLCQQRRAKAQ